VVTDYKPGAPAKKHTGGHINWLYRDHAWNDILGFRGKQDVERPAGDDGSGS